MLVEHFNLAKRICTIVSDPNIRDQRLTELREILLQRQYPISLINNGIERAKAIDIEELRTTKSKTEEKIIPYVSTHNPRNVETYNIIYQNLPFLHQDPRMKRALADQKIIKSKRQPRSLKKILTSARIQSGNNSQTPTVKKCGRSNCGICNNINEGSEFRFKDGQIFKVKHYFTCASENVIYIITCNGCGENYIGQTGMSLRKRMTVHRQQIKNPNYRQIQLSEHLDTCAGAIIPNFKLFPFYQCANGITEQERIIKESYFIKKYKPKLNNC